MQEKDAPWSKEYVPTRKEPWNVLRVVHLHRRAGLGATWAEIQRDLKEGVKPSVARILQGKSRLTAAPDDFEGMAQILGSSALRSRSVERLRAWWIYRMCFSPDPLQEQLALLWHNHFATSAIKVRNLGLMKEQNEIFRKKGQAKFGDLLSSVVKHPALLLWLDAPENRKGHPNENLARELMELFTLGIGHYTESDVKETARALTGWGVKEDKFQHEPKRHDPGTKKILNRTGTFTGDDVLKILLNHTATAKRVIWRIGQAFFGEKELPEQSMNALAARFQKKDLDLQWLIQQMLSSQQFFASKNLRSRVASPIELLLGAVRALEMLEEPPSTVLLADWSSRLGQDLFFPPNVGGWPGGRRWISSRTMILRTKCMTALLDGKLTRNGKPFDAIRLAGKYGHASNLQAVQTFYTQLILGAAPSRNWYQKLSAGLSTKSLTASSARQSVQLILTSPEGQII